MKKILVLFFVFAAIASYVILLASKGTFLSEESGYKLYSNLGIAIPAKFYVESSNGDSMVYLLVFDRSMDFKSGNGLLIIDIKRQFIGIPELSSSEIVNLPGKYVFQKKRYPNVIGALGSEFFFGEKTLDYNIFSPQKVVFNTYGPLKKYGDSIILKMK